jgi:hypothetical protein
MTISLHCLIVVQNKILKYHAALRRGFFISLIKQKSKRLQRENLKLKTENRGIKAEYAGLNGEANRLLAEFKATICAQRQDKSLDGIGGK